MKSKSKSYASRNRHEEALYSDEYSSLSESEDEISITSKISSRKHDEAGQEMVRCRYCLT